MRLRETDRTAGRGDGRRALILLMLTPLLLAPLAPARAQDEAWEKPETYRIGIEDVLEVSVYGEETLSVKELPVRPDGKISLPLLQDVQAAGETPDSLGQKLTELYSQHVVAPVVTVMVVDIKSYRIYVMGQVRESGELTLGRATTLLQALALAGGFTEFANTKKILVIRQENGRQMPITVNYERIVSGDNLEMNLWLKPGDTIVVP